MFALLNCCAHIPTLGEGWVTSTSSWVDDKERVRKSIAQVLKNLANVPVNSKDQDTKVSEGDAKRVKSITGKVDKHSLAGMNITMVGTLRKGTKSLLLLIDNACSFQNSDEKIQTSKNDPVLLSSKTD